MKTRIRCALMVILWSGSASGVPALAQPSAALWRAGELSVEFSAGASQIRIGLACQGEGCQPLQCRWQEASGEHLLSFAGSNNADYTGPGAPIRRLVLVRAWACENCRAQYVRLYWRDPTRTDADILETLWSGIDFQRGGAGRMGGFASWPNQQPLSMSCSTQ